MWQSYQHLFSKFIIIFKVQLNIEKKNNRNTHHTSLFNLTNLIWTITFDQIIPIFIKGISAVGTFIAFNTI
jgi:hypothetical protein